MKKRPAPAKVTRADRMLETREAIRRAAWELFSTQGYEATTTNAIAARAGVAAGTVFVHAKDKADLLFLVMHERLERAVEAGFYGLPRGPLLERILRVFEPIFEMYAQHPEVAVAFIRSFPGAQGPNAERTNTLTFGFLHRISLLVAEAQSAGEVGRDVDPLQAAQNVFALYFMSLLSWIAGHTSIEDAHDRVLRAALTLQMRGLSR